MKRKRIEIVSRCMGAVLALAAAGAAGAQAPDGGPAWWWSPDVEAFRVRIEADAPPMPLSDDAVSGYAAPGATDEASRFVPDIPYSYFWTQRDGLRLRARAHAQRQRVSEHSPGLLGGFPQPRVETPRTRWLAAPGAGGWAFGERNWRTRLDEGPAILLGSSDLAVPEWNESLRLSGVSLSQSFLASSEEVSQWNYSLAFGAVDQSAVGASDLIFGPRAGSLQLSYDHGPRLSVETQTEVAADLLMSGVTGQYDLGGLGRWRSGISRSNHGMHQGWRYRAMADFDLDDDLSLAWVGERYTDGFMDVRRYAAGTNPVAGGRQRWSASWDVGRWGRWSGSFESVHGKQGAQQRRFGLSQQFWYSPNLQIGIHAEREVVADDYDIGLRFSFPLY